METAEVLSAALGLPFATDERLGENDRTATGFLPSDEFERTAARFFACPDKSIRGWETATHAQARIVDAVCRIVEGAPDRRIVFVSHGAVGSLLLSHLRAVPISRDLDQPRLGCCFAFDPTTSSSEPAWRPLPDV